MLLGVPEQAGCRAMLWAYAGVAGLLGVLYLRRSPAVEAVTMGAARWGLQRSRGMVAKLSALFAVDAFAGGFIVQSVLAYWFHLRYGLDAAGLGAIFFGTGILSALSFLAAVPLARRVGLLNTMVFTHLSSNVLLAPLMPSVELTVGLLLVRHLLSQMDVPPRQSYTMAVVDPEERAAAAGIVRNTGMAAAPLFTGGTLDVPALGLPFLIAGGMKIAYDLTILGIFRGVRPPEEVRPRA